MRKSALFWLGLVVTILVALGLVVLASASGANGVRLGGDTYFFIKRQFGYLVAGLIVVTLVARFDYRNWRDSEWLTWLFYGVTIILLVAVLFEPKVKGSHRWLSFGPVGMQPGEVAKLAVVMTLAYWLDKSGFRVDLIKRGLLASAVLIAIPVGLVLGEPDFGSAMVISMAGGLLMFVAGVNLWGLLTCGVIGGSIGLALVLTNANRVARLFDKSKQYQVDMALAAIGNSKIWGAGLGESMQKHLYLPEAHTDFVFAIGAEEFGIQFSICVVLLFLAFFLLSVHIAKHAADRFGRFLVVGMAFLISFQAIFSICVVCKAMVTKGIALPFFSFGGTNYVCSFFAVGIILSVGIHSCREKEHALMRKVFLK